MKIISKALQTSPSRKHFYAFLTLLLLILMTYSNSFQASWHLDDEPNITDNRHLQMSEMSLRQIVRAALSGPSSAGVIFHRPLSRISLGLNWYFGGNSVFGYHLVNFFIHLSASFFLYLFAFHTLKLPSTGAAESAFPVALLAAAFWAVHPIQTQAVTYIVQRMTSLSGLFIIMAMYLYVRARSSAERRTRTTLLALCAVAGLLALGSKENAILLPADLFLFHILMVEGVGKGAWRRSLKRFSVYYLLPLAALLVYLEISHQAVTRVFGLYDTRTFTLTERLLTESRAIALYLSLLVYPMPHRLSIDHDIPLSTSLFNPPSTALSILLILGILIISFFQARKRPLLSFSLLFFLLNHALESTILPMELVFEHRNYVPSMPFFIPIFAAIARLLSGFPADRSLKTFAAVSIGVVLLAFAHSAFLRNAVWKDEKTLWSDVLEKYPQSSRAHNNLGRYYAVRGEEKRAAEEYLQALNGRETHKKNEKAVTLFNLGHLAHVKGDWERAVDLYRKALELDPCCPRANNNLAAVLLESGHSGPEEVLPILEKALDCNKETELPYALSNMGLLLMRMGRNREAAETLQRAIDWDPHNRVNLLRLGYLLEERGEHEKASIYFSRVADPHPRDIPAHLFLAQARLGSGHVAEAAETLRRLLDSVSIDELTQYLEEVRLKRGSLEITPRMSLLWPLLEQLCRGKCGWESVLDAFSKTIAG